MKDIFNFRSRSAFYVYIFLNIFVFIVLFNRILSFDFKNVLLCFTSIILFITPNIIESMFNIRFPSFYKICVLFFIFLSGVCGKIFNFYLTFPFLDTFLHTVNGFLCGALGVGLLNYFFSNNICISHCLIIIFIILFANFIGVLWEVVEFSSDILLKTDAQNDFVIRRFSSVEFNKKKNGHAIIVDNIDHTDIYYINNGKMDKIVVDGYLDIGIIDTMKDLIVNLCGAIFFSILFILYMGNNKIYRFMNNFIILRN